MSPSTGGSTRTTLDDTTQAPTTTKEHPTMRPAATPTTSPPTGNVSTTKAILALAGSEVRLLLRNRLVATTALVIPVLMAVGYGASGLRYGDGSGTTIALMVLTMLLLTVYMAATTSIAARRTGLVLKRMRSGETREWAILAGMLLPTVVLAAAQSVLIGAVFVAFGADLPENPLLVLAGAVGGAVLFALFALVTVRVTATPETAQVTTLPLFFAALAGAFWTITKPLDEATTLMIVNPGGAIMHLVQGGWDGGGGDMLTAAAALVFWAGLAYEIAKRTFTWEPRSS
ncbi:ABC transporter permease [Patulibacter sp.]|uniref:ABC transporter permease n=1 Tax=Patulibacter sp. TaxID=1912859 RepID=UPI002728FB69|nr:ABC transporter permease [Patulibacter sp.]MDO9410859.1 ABC transporter permease [Patulibacter sp.]